MWQSSDFGRYLRTGRIVARTPSVEVKFNPYHDPRDGRFTFAPGRGTLPPRQLGTATRVREQTASRSPVRTPPAPVPYLSRIHHELDGLGKSNPPEEGTSEWTPTRFAAWMSGASDIHNFKRNWIRGHRRAIVAAADRFDIPQTLLAGVAYTEVGGDPEEIDAVAYTLRSGDRRDRTSFGPLSVQFRRAAQSLGYDPSHRMTSSQRRAVMSSLRHGDTNIFIAAKHLADLRDRDFKGVGASKLTRGQIELIATRYNRGPDVSLEVIKRNLSYGRSITKRWDSLKKAIEN